MPVEWPEQIAEGLPAPRDDEPPALRQDIADELSDHLQSALRRELHFERDKGKAKQKVLTRFGNPSRLARRLWFDAMQEKIMSQRLTLLMSGIMAVACVAASAMAWIAVREGREVNAIIVNKLNALSPPAAAEAPKSMDEIPLKVQLVLDTKDGPPAEGYSVQFRGNVPWQEKYGTLDKKTGSDGVADFGVVRPGQHTIVVITPWEERQTRRITVLPAREYTEKIVCPSKPLEEVEIAFSVDWPDDLRGKGLWVVCDFRRSDRQLDSGTWVGPMRTLKTFGMSGTWPDGRTLIVAPSGEAFSYAGTYLSDRFSVGIILDGSAIEYRHVIKLDQKIELKFLPQLRWRGLGYVLQEINVVDPQEDRDPQKRFTVLGKHTYSTGGFDSKRLAREMKNAPEFEAQPGQLNRWKITLPDELVKQVRENLISAGQSKPAE
jgi:hypothetical protein